MHLMSHRKAWNHPLCFSISWSSEIPQQSDCKRFSAWEHIPTASLSVTFSCVSLSCHIASCREDKLWERQAEMSSNHHPIPSHSPSKPSFPASRSGGQDKKKGQDFTAKPEGSWIRFRGERKCSVSSFSVKPMEPILFLWLLHHFRPSSGQECCPLKT